MQVRKREKMAKLREEIAVQKAKETELNKTIHITGDSSFMHLIKLAMVIKMDPHLVTAMFLQRKQCEQNKCWRQCLMR